MDFRRRRERAADQAGYERAVTGRRVEHVVYVFVGLVAEEDVARVALEEDGAEAFASHPGVEDGDDDFGVPASSCVQAGGSAAWAGGTPADTCGSILVGVGRVGVDRVGVNRAGDRTLGSPALAG